MEKRRYEQLVLRERIELHRGRSGAERGDHQPGVAAQRQPSKQWTGGYDPERAQQLMLRRHARGRAHKLDVSRNFAS